MNGSLKFISGIVVILLFYAVAAWFVAHNFLKDTGDINALIYSAILATANIIAVFFIIRFTFKKDAKSSTKSFLIGYGIRFFILLGFIFAILSSGQVNNFTFLTALFILYFIYQIWEIVFLNKHFKQDSLPI